MELRAKITVRDVGLDIKYRVLRRMTRDICLKKAKVWRLKGTSPQ